MAWMRYGLLIMTIIVKLGNSLYTDEWAVHLTEGPDKAKELAEKHNFLYEGEIIPDIYQFRHKRVVRRSVEPSEHLHQSLATESEVKWVEQQFVKRRVKRKVKDNDPMWNKMWYLNRQGCLDMNVQRAWRQGYSGKGAVVTILDDGIEKDHPDLKQNYDKGASYDINDNDPDPQPRLDIFNYNRHGTRCAGEVAAVANNSICSVGIAFNAKIGGIRMLDGDITDSVEGRSIGYNQQHIDIYSASWGPDDDGRTVDGPGQIAKHAFKKGTEEGRGGKGNIFVWASGNGGRQGDSCSCDGYTNSIYTLSVSSATERGTVPWYSEPCASSLATTYSSGSGVDRMIMTTDLRHLCTDRHTGTSASAPLAAGVLAVVLEANPYLTWRDIQHITVRTANPKHLITGDWVTNGVGLKVSHSFGYGMMDTSAMVDLAKNWTTVPPALTCTSVGTTAARSIPKGQTLATFVTTDGCISTDKEIKALEHVQAKITLEGRKRGGLSIFLTSPSGTKSTLLPKRSRDYHSEGFRNWEFLSVHTWGESPVGKWTLEIHTDTEDTVLKSWSLIMHGTKTLPSQIPYKRKSTNSDCKQVDNGRGAGRPSHHHGSGMQGDQPFRGPHITAGKAQDDNSIGYYQPCNPNKLNCAGNMVCIPYSVDKTFLYICNCLQSLVFNHENNQCEPVKFRNFLKRKIPESVPKRTLFSTPVIFVISSLFAVLIIGAIVMYAVFQCKSHKKYGPYRNLGAGATQLAEIPKQSRRL